MFPKEFIWGSATAAYQIEGGWDLDGKGSSIWDAFTHTPGKIMDKQNGDVTCDHIHRFREDVALMKKLGMKAYRFSICWPRLLPEGTGRVNEAGVQFYNELIDELLAADIVPYITLYHWDLPLRLMEKGGWCNRDMAEYFAEYTALVADRFGDRVKHFFTLNETSVFLKGLINGVHAPGLKMSPNYYILAHHNALLAHGRAVQILREKVPGVQVGIGPALLPYMPKTEKDLDACRNALFSVNRVVNGEKVNPVETAISVPSMLLDPIVFGKYPEDGVAAVGQFLPECWQEDLKTISQPIDFIAFNTYQGRFATDDGNGGINMEPLKPGYARTAIDWPVNPECLYWSARFLYERYKLPIIVSENGISTHDWVALDGKVHDPNRIDYLQRHLLQLEKAIGEGVDVRGYFHWSLMDNLEWARGFYDRFGLIYVDFTTGERTVKDSGYWYKEIIESNGERLHCYG